MKHQSTLRSRGPLGIRAVVALLPLLMWGGCSLPGTRPTSQGLPTRTQSAEQVTLVVALAQVPVSLDPADFRDRPSETVVRNMFDGLVTRDHHAGIHLELAETLEWRDETTLEVRLRRDVLFHDGVEMTAEDVVFSFQRVIQENAIDYPEPHSSPRQSLVTPLESIEATGPYEAIMHFSGPWPPALQLLVHQQIVPKHYLEDVGTAGFIAHPIGTGPFRFVSASDDLRHIILERFDEYYGGAPTLPPVGAACVDRVVFRAIPDADTRIAALRVGEVDIAQAVPSHLVALLEDDARVQVRTAPGTQPKWMEMNVKRSPFDDARVRRALNYAIDKGRIIAEVYGGRAEPLPGPLSPHNVHASRDLQPYTYDPQQATRLLSQAGWVDRNGDGLLDRDGETFSFVIDTLPEWYPLTTAVATQLLEVGIDATVLTWDAQVIRPLLIRGERMAYLDDWGDSAFDPVGHFEAKWHGPVLDQPYGRANFSGYNNERVNELIELGEKTADPDARQAIYEEAQRLVYEEAPAIFLVLPEEIEAASSQIANWSPAADGRINLHDVCKLER